MGIRGGRLEIRGWGLLLFMFLLGCTAVSPPPPSPAIDPQTDDTILPTPTLLATASVKISPTETGVSPATPIPDTGWEEMYAGFERRIRYLYNENGRAVEQLYILRIDPTQYEFQVNYRPGEPQSLSAWQTETDALVVLNGGFFTEEYVATGLIIVDGQASGTSYGAFAGMFTVMDGLPELRWLAERPYSADEPLQYALQSFPLLIKPGGVLGYPDEDGRANRRTVIGMDRNGRILILLTPWGYFTLHQLSQFLVESDLDLEIALNLDGGTSTGLILSDPDETIPAFIPLPAIISITPR